MQKPYHIENYNQILTELKQRIVEKYHVLEMQLFGSIARGEGTEDSDFDIFICLPTVNRNIEEDIFDIAYDIELKYNCLIDIIILSKEQLQNSNKKLPIYQNIIQEGIEV